MRVGLPLMMVLSLALHLSLAFGVFLSSSHSQSTPEPQETQVKSTLTLMPNLVATTLPREAPLKSLPSLLQSNSTQNSMASSPVVTPKETDSHALAVLKSAHDSNSPPSLLEANPNAHIPQPRLEPILNPNPPPVLNSKDGVVFVLDVSGSMYEPDARSTRLAAARQALTQRINSLKDGTPFAITVYAEKAHNSGPLVAASSATREAAIRFILSDFDCGGGTNLAAGFAMAQELHAGSLVLVSDGDLNVSPKDLLRDASHILGSAGHAPALDIVAIDPREHTEAESVLESLANQEGGNFSIQQSDGSVKLLTSNKAEATAQ